MPDTIDVPTEDRALPRERVEDALAEITALLRKHRLVEGLVREQGTDASAAGPAALTDNAVTRQSKAALVQKLDRLHAADVAHLLEALPLDERLYVWDLVRAARDGEILLEVSDAVRESLISSMDTEELVAATEIARGRRDRRARARPAAGGDGRRPRQPARRGARAAPRRDVVRR